MTRLRSTGQNLTLLTPLLALTAGLWCACAAGAEYNVGGPSPDFDSIGQAVNSSEPGDTIVVHPGEYYENLFIPHDLTLTSTDPSDEDIVAATIIDGSQEAPVIELNSELSDQALITGLTIRNGYAQFFGEGGQTGGGGISGRGSLARIERNIILGNTDQVDPFYGGGRGGGPLECNGTIIGNQIVANQDSREKAP